MRVAHRVGTTLFAFTAVSFLNAPHARAADPVPWSITPPSGAEVQAPGDPIRLTVKINTDDVQGFKVVEARILEQTRHFNLFPQAPTLCKLEPARPDGKAGDLPVETVPCNDVGTLTKATAYSILLRPAVPGPTAGHFSGPVTFVANGNPTGQSVNVELYLTTWWHQGLGVLAVFVGAILGWLISNWAKNRYNRAQLLLPAAFTRQRLEGISQILDQAPPALPSSRLCPSTLAKIDMLQESLSDDALESGRYIPPEVPSPGTAAPLRLDDYTRFLAGVNAWITVLESVVGRGITQAWHTRGETNITDTMIVKALQDLDAIITGGDSAPAIATVDTQVSAALAPLRTANAAALLPQAGAPGQATPEPLKVLRVRLTHTSMLMWVATIAVTTLAGSYVVVFSNLGFGLPTDYIVCTFFGLGLPTGAAMLQQTGQSVAAALGVSVK